MQTGTRRLNRRRYRESVNALREIIADKKTPPQRKLKSIELLLSIYDRHDRTEAAKEAHRKVVETSQDAGQPQASTEVTESVEERAAALIARLNLATKTEDENE